MDLIKPNALTLMTCVCFMNYYVYDFRLVENFDLVYDNLYALSVCIVSSIYADTSIIILSSAMYMILCVSITHMSYWEFLYMHPFVWSIIHSCDIDSKHFISLISVRHIAYAVQRLTPESIHTRLSIALAGGIFVFVDYAKKINHVRQVNNVSWYYVCLHVIHNIIYMLLWSPTTPRFYIDYVQICIMISSIFVMKFVSNMYIRFGINACIYAISYWLPMDMALSINRSMTLGLKEELYARVRVNSYIRFFEHASSFSVFFIIHAFNIEIPRLLIIILASLLFFIQCIMHSIHSNLSVIDCRCNI
jgi:hypothetical protein